MDTTKLWELASETMYAFGPFYQDEMYKAIQATGAPANWFPLSLARGADPEPITLVRMTELNPYTNPGRHVENLTFLAEKGLLETVNGEAYRLSAKGREAVETVFASALVSLSQPLPVPNKDLEHITQLLARVVKAALESPEPKLKWALEYSRWTDPGEKETPASRVDQYLTDLLRFRDDVHLAAWTPLMINGPAWEALTFLWRDEANSVATLAEQLSFRGHDEGVYQDAYTSLEERGWIEPGSSKGTYQLTESGLEVRESAEAETNRLFFEPWAVLSEEELALLEKLLKRTMQTLHTETNLKVWELFGEASQAITKWTRSAVNPIAEKHDLNARGHLYTMLITYAYRPEPVTATSIGVRMPYSHPDALEDVLAALAARGVLSTLGEGMYALTEAGLDLIEELFEAFYGTLAAGEVMEADHLANLEGNMERLVKASLQASKPEKKRVLALSQKGHPEKEFGLLARIDQHLDDLNAFRDDSHLAAWAPYHVRPEAWDAFTQIWRGEVESFEDLVERMKHRGYSDEAYRNALANLVSRGWLALRGDWFEITEAGDSLRSEAEDKTNQLFFSPWETLSGTERNGIRFSLHRLAQILNEKAAEEVPVA